MLRRLLLMCVAGMAWTLCGCEKQGGTTEEGQATAPAARAAADKRPTIAVIPKGTTHVFWKSVERGALEAGEELDVEIIWKGPLKENDRAQQIQVVQQFISQGVDGIALAPLDSRALIAPVQAATAQGIPVVVLDSGLDAEAGKDFISFVATNNEQGGRLGGEHLAQLLGGQGSVVLLRYMVGSASTTNREQGFLDAIGQHPGIKVLMENRYAGATAGEAKTQALNLLDQIRAADGIFCPNESSTVGMLLALQHEGLAGKVRFVGFDASPPLVKALTAGEMDALVVQNPRKMGHTAVKTLVQYLNGEPVERVIDTGVVVVTRDNKDKPEIQRLID